jgi:phospholipase/carboxylesterase
MNRRRWVATTLILLGGASLALQPWEPRLSVHRKGGKGPPSLMLLHGEGSRPADLFRDTGTIGFPSEGRFLLPLAPEVLTRTHDMPGNRVWWDLDLALYQRRGGPGVDLTSMDPRGLERAARLVRTSLGGEGNSTEHPFVLGGFSQGAMVAAEVAFNSDEPLAALVLLSGTYVDSTGWGWKSPKRRGLPVFMAHGRQDDVFPFEQAERLRDALYKGQGEGSRGVEVTFVPFDGGHEITAEVQMELAAFLVRIREAARRKQSELAGDTLVPPPSSNVRDLPRFPDDLPACDPAAITAAMAPLEPALELVGTRVTFTGTLSPSKYQMCTGRGCQPGICCNSCWTPWQVSRFGNSDAVIALQRTLPEMSDCERLPPIKMLVVATGVLALGDLFPLQQPNFALEQANLCAIAPSR